MPIPVSVVIPYFDGSRFLPDALASIASQTAPPAEVIVVDDGSSTAERRRLAELADGLTVIRLEHNAGPGVARNAGVDAATQPLVAFLDADDIWLPEKLELQYRFMQAWPALDATYTGAVAFSKDGEEIVKDIPDRALTAAVALSRHEMVTPSIMMKRTTFLELGGFDPHFRCTQDWDLQIRMVLEGRQVQGIDRVLVRVRREGHGNHSANWRCYLAGHFRVLVKHRRAYIERVGTRGWLHLLAQEASKAGVRQRGWIGKGLRAPFRLGV